MECVSYAACIAPVRGDFTDFLGPIKNLQQSRRFLHAYVKIRNSQNVRDGQVSGCS